MGKFRKVDPRIWNDAKFRTLSDNAKLAFLFLLTHPHMTALGAMRATPDGLAAELGWTPEAFREAFREVTSEAMAKADEKACFVWLPNFLKYNGPESPNVLRAWAGAWDLLPECDLKARVFQHVKAFAEDLTEGFRKAFREAWPHPSFNPEPEPEPEQKPPPPPTPSNTSKRTPAQSKNGNGGGGGICESDPRGEAAQLWRAVETRLAKLGVADAVGACRAARDRGLTVDAVAAIANVYDAARGAWGPGALHYRVTQGVPGVPAADGWPERASTSDDVDAARDYKRRKQAEVAKEGRRMEICKRLRREGKTPEEVDAALDAAGLT